MRPARRPADALVLAHDQNGVVAGDGADGFRPILSIECGGHGLRAANAGLGDQQDSARRERWSRIPAPDATPKASDPIQLPASLPGKRISGSGLHQAEFANVARKRRLPGIEAALVQQALQFLLARDRASSSSSRIAFCRDSLLMDEYSPNVNNYSSIVMD